MGKINVGIGDEFPVNEPEDGKASNGDATSDRRGDHGCGYGGHRGHHYGFGIIGVLGFIAVIALISLAITHPWAALTLVAVAAVLMHLRHYHRDDFTRWHEAHHRRHAGDF